jgi:hypothetical protein
MQLLSPEILADARGLSVVLCGGGLGVGLLLWLFGWWGHRFWIVLFTTVSAGLLGLYSGRAYGVQPVVAGLLLAITAGLLALALVRLLAFVAGGLAACLAIRTFAPGWDEPLVYFLSGGLVGVLLFRLWTMALTSMAGSVLMAYSGLLLLDRLDKLDALALAERSPALLSWACFGTALVGLVIQFLIDRWWIRRERWCEEFGYYPSRYEREQILRFRPWWSWRTYRRAG